MNSVCRFVFKTFEWSACIYLEKSACQQDDTRDIFLDGIVARNRALNGDIVVVQLLPRDQWKVEQLLSLLYSHRDYPQTLMEAFVFQVVRSDTDCEGSSEPDVQKENKGQTAQKKQADGAEFTPEDELVRKLINTSLTSAGNMARPPSQLLNVVVISQSASLLCNLS